MIINGKEEKLELTYPCHWEYRVMCLSHIEINDVVLQVLNGRDCKVNKGNQSKTGKYQSFNIKLLVHNDDDRTLLFELLKKHEHVAMVL